MLYVKYWTHGLVEATIFVDRHQFDDRCFFNSSDCRWIVPGTLNYSDFG